MKNPFKRLKQLEQRVTQLEITNGQLHGLIIALARTQMLNPEILQEHYLEQTKNLEYLREMAGK